MYFANTGSTMPAQTMSEAKSWHSYQKSLPVDQGSLKLPKHHSMVELCVYQLNMDKTGMQGLTCRDLSLVRIKHLYAKQSIWLTLQPEAVVLV